LKSATSFTGVAIGDTATLPHHLVISGTKLKPDSIRMQFGSFEFVSADTTNITILNVSNTAGACVVLAEAWHPIERVFGMIPDDGTFGQHLTPQPFVESPDSGGSGGGGAFSVVVLRPGGISTENVVTTWADAVALLALSQGPRILEFDDSISTPIVVPVGTFNMTGVIWSGGAGTITPAVHVPEGTVFTGLRAFDARVVVTFTGTAAPVSDFTSPLGRADVVVISNGAIITTSGAGPFFHVPDTGAPSFELHTGAQLATGTHAIIDIASDSQAAIQCLGGLADLQSNTVSGPVGAALFVIVAASGIVGASQVQAAFGGTLTATNTTKVRQYPTAALTANTVLSVTSQVVKVDPTAGAFAVTLPAAANHEGESITIKNVSASVNAVTVTAGAGDSIDGAATAPLSADHFNFTVTSDGVHLWMVTGA
ncbi:MAG: hypothetical protein WA418_07905, partial [Bradyrhizobium sp.]